MAPGLSRACGSFTPLPSSGAARGAARVRAPFLPEAESPSTVAGPHELYRRPAVDSVPPLRSGAARSCLRGAPGLTGWRAGPRFIACGARTLRARRPPRLRSRREREAPPPPAKSRPRVLFQVFCLFVSAFFIMAIAPAALLPPHGFSLTKPPKRKGVRGV